MRLSALSLKLIAIAAMVVDHVAFTFVPYGTPLWTVMDAAGKLTAPSCFLLLAVGLSHQGASSYHSQSWRLTRRQLLPFTHSISAPWVSRSR